MRVRVDEIPESGRFLHFHWGQNRLKQYMQPDDPFAMELVRPVNVDLEIHKRPDHIRIIGSIESILRLTCHRCLDDFQWLLREQVDVFLVEDKNLPQDEEKELEVDELEYEFFDGEIIELDQLVAEQIFLALPYKVLCSESCKGLCQNCGANLNQAACSCRRSTKTSPFAGLEQMKEQLVR
ncbi:YceD family protein [Desulfoferrobacter suflitae]|uniref:YceD family protein n=1 Tax=Desulfoferrobacter suflitae TaxID=2865782 RepID=UPI002164A63F|nr:DUF177 domain-containing protein [Desulfoferrobacter suflitae]MCK8601916.1 DUF177 domain-containing protein [Desulfoferrobacter suflitae]